MLKGDCQIPLDGTRLDIYMNEVAVRGGVVSYATAGSGAALDQSKNLGTYAANSSGQVPVGFLFDDMVNIDLTRYKLNQHKREVNIGSKVTIVNRGWLVTSNFVGTPAVGPAYLSSSGNLTSTFGGTVQTPLVGRFDGTADEDGYVKVYINLP